MNGIASSALHLHLARWPSGAEFYKDIVKVIIWNQKRKKKLSCLVFITDEKHGRPFLDAPMPRAYIKYLEQEGVDS